MFRFTIRAKSVLIALLTLITANAHAGSDKSIEALLTEFKQGQLENQVRAQYYRWFLPFELEQNETRILNHSKLFTEDVVVTAFSGPMQGKAGVRGFLNYVKDWKNAHHIESTNITRNKDGDISLEADIIYQNILPDGKRNNYRLHYTTQLQEGNPLPQFKSLTLLPVETLGETDYQDAYLKNRTLSFVNYWSYLLDNIDSHRSEFKALLASDFEIIYDENTQLRSLKDVDAWIDSIAVGMKQMLHRHSNVKAHKNNDDTITIELTYDWQAITKSGEHLKATTEQSWIVSNNLDDEFPKLIKINSKVLDFSSTKIE